MNTKDLQKQFKNDYERLYSNSDIVTSWYFWFSRFPVWLGQPSNRINIKSKIPLKVYVWLKKTKRESVVFKNFAIFDIDKNKFWYKSFSWINKQSDKIINFLEKILLEKKLNFWLDINVLSEVAIWHGLWFSWTVFVTLITWLYILGWIIDKKLLEDYIRFKKSDEFKEILSLARKLELISKQENVWSTTMLTLSNLKSPIIYFTEYKKELKWLDELENQGYYFSNFSEKFGYEWDLWELSFDYAILYTWSLWSTSRIRQLKQSDKNYFKVYEEFFHNELEKEIEWKHYISTIFDKESFYEWLNEVWSTLTLETVYIFKQIMKFGDTNQNIDLLINNINKLSSISEIVEWSWEFIEDFKYYFKKNSSDINEELWIMPIYSGKRWWDFLVVMRHSAWRKAFDQAVQDLKYKYNHIQEQYVSRKDGFISEWIKLEQFVSWWEFSNHVSKDKVVYLNNQWEKYMDDYWDILKKEKTWFLLDSIWWKIYMNGIKLTSKDIKSQSTTIELFDLLLENLWEDIYNNQLSPSTYASQQNQMLWKIVMPFVKLVERNFWEKLPLTCNWSLREFYVRLETTGIKIWIIKKI